MADDTFFPEAQCLQSTDLDSLLLYKAVHGGNHGENGDENKNPREHDRVGVALFAFGFVGNKGIAAFPICYGIHAVDLADSLLRVR